MKFPARQPPAVWTATTHSERQILEDLNHHPGRATGTTHDQRKRGVRKLLLWLKDFPGETWQQRWYATPAHSLGGKWDEEALAWLVDHDPTVQKRGALKAGFLWLVCADVLRPDVEWLSTIIRSRHWRNPMATYRDPEGFAQLHAAADRQGVDDKRKHQALIQITTIMAAKGGKVADITVGDCLELREVESRTRNQLGAGRGYFYDLLQQLEFFPADAPPTLRQLTMRSGQVSPGQLVDRYALECGPVRDLIVDYLAERQPALDYNTLEQLSRHLALHFWKNIETHYPGASSLRLPSDVIAAWKSRLQVKTRRERQPDGSVREVTTPRSSYIDLLTNARGLYLDIAQWATEDPARWGPWAAPCPITAAEISGRKRNARRKARMDQRTRERLPTIAALVQVAHQQRVDAQARLTALRNAAPGETFTVLGEVFVKAVGEPSRAVGSDFAYDSAGRLRQLARAENRAFWAWASVEVLRHTGLRAEEMLEISHQSITQYVVPDTGELIPLLHIAPSKTDQERLLVVDLELADVLATVVSRVRGDAGVVPLVSTYDVHEKTWNPPMPILFQSRAGGQNHPLGQSAIRRVLDELLLAAGFTDAGGQPLQFQPHDFRRIFTTEAILNGMPPHIVQLILGHKSIDTTMGYHTVYPQEVINGHRAFIARRRAMRPSEEYRTPTDQEWEEFLGHFERRKMALGDCGRAYGTSCQHEHSCIRCPLLRVDPAERPRMEEIRDNMIARIAEAEHQGWLGEVERLQVSRAAAEGKLAQLDERARRATTINLGMPSFPEIAGRTATLPGRRP
ncbi:tyrosine-type recombinase/integrase [Streptosporangium lutulentum]|uniref:Integrase n=1 Tax=Streptosporangium lutulentum TaxID=1461250 RepID=A0ABT9QKU4_9ACTN|nr:site-specific integrase [Streptosporangium lutulentum]MDP9847377.1 integrase [Streptosporangium lutulentum]